MMIVNVWLSSSSVLFFSLYFFSICLADCTAIMRLVVSSGKIRFIKFTITRPLSAEYVAAGKNIQRSKMLKNLQKKFLFMKKSFLFMKKLFVWKKDRIPKRLVNSILYRASFSRHAPFRNLSLWLLTSGNPGFLTAENKKRSVSAVR